LHLVELTCLVFGSGRENLLQPKQSMQISPNVGIRIQAQEAVLYLRERDDGTVKSHRARRPNRSRPLALPCVFVRGNYADGSGPRHATNVRLRLVDSANKFALSQYTTSRAWAEKIGKPQTEPDFRASASGGAASAYLTHKQTSNKKEAPIEAAYSASPFKLL
jgi:hypothetical protein